MIYERALFGIILVVGVIAAIYFFSAVHKYFTQSSNVYHPKKEIIATPLDIGLDFKDIVFKASDGIGLSGWYIPANRSKKVILLLHGNGGNISTRLTFIDFFYRRLGLSTFIIDYRGYGKSEGKATEKGTYLDAEAAWKYLTGFMKIKNKDIIVFGRSLGGPIAAWLAKKISPGALVLDSTFTSIKDMAAHVYPLLPVKKIFRFDYPTLEYLKDVRCPVLVIHSSEEDYIPFSHGRKLFEEANEPKHFLEIKGTHRNNYLESKEDYLEGINSFIKKY